MFRPPRRSRFAAVRRTRTPARERRCTSRTKSRRQRTCGEVDTNNKIMWTNIRTNTLQLALPMYFRDILTVSRCRMQLRGHCINISVPEHTALHRTCSRLVVSAQPLVAKPNAKLGLKRCAHPHRRHGQLLQSYCACIGVVGSAVACLAQL